MRSEIHSSQPGNKMVINIKPVLSDPFHINFHSSAKDTFLFISDRDLKFKIPSGA